MKEINQMNSQELAIKTTEGPMLIIAGPGTGKTYTLVERIKNLILNHGVQASEILISTFTEKAAKELVTRISNAFFDSEKKININEMYIGTFHSICLRILKENLELTRLKKNYRTLDAFDQCFTIFQNIKKFKKIEHYPLVINDKSPTMSQAQDIAKWVNTLIEELVSSEELLKDSDPKSVALGRILDSYLKLTSEYNLMDFSQIQSETYKLLKNNPAVLSSINSKIRYLMIDEYQDTNYIQEQLVLMLGGKSQNICVVGDDDQALYRFRGATVRNILEFNKNFEDGKSKTFYLTKNYRSTKQIVNFYNTWMRTTEGDNFGFKWNNYRFEKQITSNEEHPNNNAVSVGKLNSIYDEKEWFESVYRFIERLKKENKITDYNQIAFLFKSVKNEKAINLANFLESKGISVYSPRSALFFERDEVRFVLGVLMLSFPQYIEGLENKSYKFLNEAIGNYYVGCIKYASEHLLKDIDFAKWIVTYGRIHKNLSKNTDYAFTAYLYQIFRFEPFKTLLSIEDTANAVSKRPAHNLSLLTKILGKFEYIKSLSVLTKENITKNVEDLFNLYLRLLYEGGISEYEDDAEYAPSGCISFLTIHQSKGMEFPIVFIDSLSSFPKKSWNDISCEIEKKFYKKAPFEPYESIKFFDFWRWYYTGFSRAQDLLVLTCNENDKTPSKYFKPIMEQIPAIDDKFDISNFKFHEVKPVNIKPSFSFTSHVAVYETCPRQYRFFKEFEFQPVRTANLMFGKLVHETIEDIHKAALRGESDLITKDNIQSWFDVNYDALSKAEHSYLSKPQRDVALRQVINYADRQKGKWSVIKEAEVDVSLVRPEYIIEGKIDLIKGDNDTVEIVDFKSEHKPDIFSDRERLEKYRRQLHIYAYLVEQRTGHKVSKMHLYYTAEDSGNPMISFPYTKTAIDGTISSFDDTVHHILKKDFKKCATESKTCRNCDFRFYCEK